MSVPSTDMLYRLKWLTAPQTLSVSTTTATIATELTPGLYEITADADCFFLQGASDVTATTSSNPLWSKEWRLVHVEDDSSDGADTYIAAITSSGTATLYVVKKES